MNTINGKPVDREILQHESEIGTPACCNSFSVGVGDLVAGCTRFTGIAWAVARFRGSKGCGCASRRSRWNRIRLRTPVYISK